MSIIYMLSDKELIAKIQLHDLVSYYHNEVMEHCWNGGPTTPERIENERQFQEHLRQYKENYGEYLSHSGDMTPEAQEEAKLFREIRRKYIAKFF